VDERVYYCPANVDPRFWVVGGKDVLENEHHAKYDIERIDDEVNFIRLKPLLNLKPQLVLLYLIISLIV
jgi:hypothetical protein